MLLDLLSKVRPIQIVKQPLRLDHGGMGSQQHQALGYACLNVGWHDAGEANRSFAR
jgi:hypothetical protein